MRVRLRGSCVTLLTLLTAYDDVDLFNEWNARVSSVI